MPRTEEITVKYKVDATEATQAVDKLEKEFEELDKTIKDSQRTNKQASAERTRLLEKEEKELKELREARKKAFSSKELDLFNKKIDSQTKKVKTLKTSVDKTSKAGKLFQNQLVQIGSAMAAAFALERIVSFTSEVVKLAAQAEGVKRAFDLLNAPNLLGELKKATKGTVSDLELMKQAVRANNFQIPLENLATFFEFARRRAAQTGESVDFLVNSIVLGIGRKSALVLDNLGISAIRLREEFAKTGDTSQAVANIINTDMNKMGEDIDTTANKLNRLSAGWENFKVSAGESIIIVFDSFSEKSQQFATANEALMSDLAIASEIWKIPLEELTQEYTTLFGEQIVTANDKGKELLSTMSELNKTQMEWNDALVDFSDIQSIATMSVQDLVDAFNAEKNTIKFLKASLKSLREERELLVIGSSAFMKVEKEILEVEKKLKDASEEYTDDLRRRAALKEADIALSSESIDLENEALEAELEGIEKRKQAQKDADEELLASSQKRYEADVEMNDEAQIKKFESENRTNEEVMEQRQMVQQATFDLAVGTADAILSHQRAVTNAEILMIQKKAELGVLTEKEAAEQISELRREQAEKERILSVFEAIINTAVAVTKALKDGGPPLAVLVGSLGALEIATIMSTPVPAFKEGVIDFQGEGTETSDSNLVRISRRESVMTADETKEYKDELLAMRSGNYREMMAERFHAQFMDGMSGIAVKVKVEDSPTQRKMYDVLKDTKRQSTVNTERLIKTLRHSKMDAYKVNKRFHG